MQEVSKDIFYRTIEGWKHVSHTQEDAWCNSWVPAATLRYYLDDRQPATMGCVGYIRHKLGMNMLLIAGECMRDTIDHKSVRDFYANIPQLGFDIVEINSDSIYSPEYETGIREAGLLRPVGLFSTTLSKVVDLGQPFTYDKSWQRNLKKSEQAELTFRLYTPEEVTDELIGSYVRLQQEMMERKRFNDGISASQLRSLLQDRRFAIGFIAHNGEPMAGMIAYMPDNSIAKSLFSVTSPAGRELAASYIMYREMMRYAAEQRHCSQFDLGRISPSAHAKNNLFLFKNGIGGTIVQYNGEWQWCKRRWMPLMLYFMKKYIWKRVQV